MRETDLETRESQLTAYFRRERLRDPGLDPEVSDAIKVRVLAEINTPGEDKLTTRQQIDTFILKLIYRCADLFN